MGPLSGSRTGRCAGADVHGTGYGWTGMMVTSPGESAAEPSSEARPSDWRPVPGWERGLEPWRARGSRIAAGMTMDAMIAGVGSAGTGIVIRITKELATGTTGTGGGATGEFVCSLRSQMAVGCPTARSRRLVVMRWTRSSGPWGRLQCDQGSMCPGGEDRPCAHQMVAPLKTKFPWGPG